ncbi:hypothetical protein NKH18_43850 [Streptomyces sp. M10(2022)]
MAFWQRDASRIVTSAFDKEAAAKAAEYLDQHQIGDDNVGALRKAGRTCSRIPSNSTRTPCSGPLRSRRSSRPGAATTWRSTCR